MDRAWDCILLVACMLSVWRRRYFNTAETLHVGDKLGDTTLAKFFYIAEKCITVFLSVGLVGESKRIRLKTAVYVRKTIAAVLYLGAAEAPSPL